MVLTERAKRVQRNLYGGSAAIDRQNRTLDETGAVARQEHDRLGNLLRRGRTPGRRLRRKLLQRASPIAAVPSVRVGPGLTAFTRTPLGPYSAAHALVSRLMAALLDP